MTTDSSVKEDKSLNNELTLELIFMLLF